VKRPQDGNDLQRFSFGQGNSSGVFHPDSGRAYVAQPSANRNACGHHSTGDGYMLE